MNLVLFLDIAQNCHPLILKVPLSNHYLQFEILLIFDESLITAQKFSLIR